MGPKNLLYFVSLSLCSLLHQISHDVMTRQTKKFICLCLYIQVWMTPKKFIKKTSEISVILISSKKYAKNIFNFQLTTQNATKDPDELPDDWPQRVQELLLQQLLLYYNHHREILSCFLEITTMKMNIRPVIFLPPECIIVQPLMTTHKNVWDLFCWNTL